MTARCTLNGHGFQFLFDALLNNAYAKLKRQKKKAIHPLLCPSEKFPGLHELSAQDPRPAGTFFADANAYLDLEFSDDAIASIQSVLLEEMQRARQILRECENHPQPWKVFNIPEALNAQLEELLYFARWFQCDLNPEDDALAQQVMERRIQGNVPGCSDLTTTVPLIPKVASESFEELVTRHLQALPTERWNELRAYAADSNNPNDILEAFDPDLTPERLVNECILEVSGPLMSDYLKGNYETSADKLGEVEGKPVYYINAGGFYIYEHPNGHCLQVDITLPATPPGW